MIGMDENWELMNNYSGQSSNMQVKQYAPEADMLRLAIRTELNVPAYQNEPYVFSLDELFTHPDTSNSCLPEGITFITQAQIDNFQTNYPGCTEIAGDVTIQGSGITNLNGLSILTSIGGNLWIYSSDALASLTGLEGLTSIGGPLGISGNNSLTSLSGLENIAAGSIADLSITSNLSLSTCQVQSICDFLAAPNGTVSISNNAPGCNSPEEVLEACAVGVGESAIGSQQSAVIINPNPTNGSTEFLISNFQFQPVTLKVCDIHGRDVADLLDQKLPAGEHVVRWDATGLPAGMYFARLQAGNEFSSMKLIKVE
jgi:hypothetical protein